MKLYLARHGEYMLDDPAQGGALSETGIATIQALVNYLQPLKIEVANILHSGKPRTQQTADILAAGFICQDKPQAYKGIQPDDPLDPALVELPNWGGDLLIVSHQPFLTRLISKLVVNDETREILHFHPGTLACLKGDAHSPWVIQWVLPPTA